jgi:hypothetical protein
MSTPKYSHHVRENLKSRIRRFQIMKLRTCLQKRENLQHLGAYKASDNEKHNTLTNDFESRSSFRSFAVLRNDRHLYKKRFLVKMSQGTWTMRTHSRATNDYTLFVEVEVTLGEVQGCWLVIRPTRLKKQLKCGHFSSDAEAFEICAEKKKIGQIQQQFNFIHQVFHMKLRATGLVAPMWKDIE